VEWENKKMCKLTGTIGSSSLVFTPNTVVDIITEEPIGNAHIILTAEKGISTSLSWKSYKEKEKEKG
jgi:hypothetical protein